MLLPLGTHRRIEPAMSVSKFSKNAMFVTIFVGCALAHAKGFPPYQRLRVR